MMGKIGYIGNFYKIPEYLIHSSFTLSYVIVESGYMSSELFTFLKVRCIPYMEVDSGDKLIEALKSVDVDLWLTCSFGKRIPIEKIEGMNIYNIHYAKLPNYKGRHPTFYATVSDEKKVGISLHKVTRELDCGEIISQYLCDYYIWENENDIFFKLTNFMPMLLEDLYKYINENLKVNLKNESGSYFKPVSESDIMIDVDNDTPTHMYNVVRAQSKYRGALLEYSDRQFWVKKLFFSPVKCVGFLNIKKDNYFVVMKVTERE